MINSILQQEEKYHYIFETAGVSIWEEDFSQVKNFVKQLQAQGIVDLRQYFIDHPAALPQVIKMVKVRDVNPYTLKLFGAASKAELLGKLSKIFIPETEPIFLEKVITLAEGKRYLEAESVVQTLQGKRLDVVVTITFPEAEDQFESVLVSLLDITKFKRAEQNQRLLAEIGQVLAASLDYEATLQSVARLALPHLADYCLVYLAEPDGLVHQVAEAHIHPQQEGLLRVMGSNYQPSLQDSKSIVGKVLQTGEAVVIPELETEALLAQLLPNHPLRPIIQTLDSKSAMILPLIARGRILGTISFTYAESGRRYDAEDLSLAEELARRVALAVDNARLYLAEQQARQVAEQTAERLNQLQAQTEQRVKERAKELEIANQKLKMANVKLGNEIIERQRSEARFSTTFHTSPAPICISTLAEGRFVDVNRSFLRWLGYSREEIIGQTSLQLELAVDPTYRLKMRQILEEQGSVHDFENSYYTKSGKIRKAIFSTEIIELEGETCLLTIFYDITERERLAAELAEVQHRLVESLERERIQLAQELHDGAVQELYSVSFGLNRLEETVLDPAALEQLAAMQSTLQQGIQMLRNIFTEIRAPALLTPFGLERAILSHLEEFQAKYPDLRVHLELTPDGDQLSERMRLAFFRIYQEALHNIVRHAQAKQLWVRLSLSETQVVLEIEDDGRGFEVPERWLDLARQGHLGLVGIFERAEAIGGHLQLSSTRGVGTKVRVVAPRQALDEP
jgi:PAS domain S-box-containing protein